MDLLTDRRRNMLIGAIALLLLASSISVGVKAAFGAYAGGYKITGSFDAAGQGLLPGSDVKIRGVNVGSVRKVRLVDGRALVTMRIHGDQKVPTAAKAVIRAKTLFGEKFVDLDLTRDQEVHGPYLHGGQRLRHTEGGFELESVLTDVYPLLKSIDPTELYTVISNLAEGGRGLGQQINRSIVNGDAVAKVFADHNADTAQFLHDLALLSQQLGTSANDFVGFATSSNEALPVLNDHADDLTAILQQTGRLSADLADVLEHNKPFLDAALDGGSKALQILYDHRTQVVPLVIGLREYVQTLSEVIRIDAGDGTLLAAVKAVFGGQVCGVVPCQGGPGNMSATAPTGTVGPTAKAPAHAAAKAPENGLEALLRRLLGG
jgi:phospholipid/cholesterol/gamma-HCH transport system substrate-binding protein